MGHTTELHEQTGAAAGHPAEAVAGAWTKIKHVCVRAVFWTYKRGSWQYDLIVLAILGFIFLTPRAWYTPQPPPPVTGFLKNQGIVDIERIKNNWSYFVDARLSNPGPIRSPKKRCRIS